MGHPSAAELKSQHDGYMHHVLPLAESRCRLQRFPEQQFHRFDMEYRQAKSGENNGYARGDDMPF
jgi:hypothetical protein